MEQIRKPFQGVVNIIRFNWHYYILSVMIIIAIILLKFFISARYHFYFDILLFLIIFFNLVSLSVSFWVYDCSHLYKLSWLDKFITNEKVIIVNINAGFDETSELLHAKYSNATLEVFDFYNLAKHTEVSIKRARKAYPPYKGTKQISTSSLPLENDSVDNIFVILSAHEIRNDEERIAFFKELNRVSKPSGKIIITEHLRDLPNFLAYNIGFFHFLSKHTWLKTFSNANLKICHQIKVTPFITTFILQKNGPAS
jgi:SAM-dependent methyltransferase